MNVFAPPGNINERNRQCNELSYKPVIVVRSDTPGVLRDGSHTPLQKLAQTEIANTMFVGGLHSSCHMCPHVPPSRVSPSKISRNHHVSPNLHCAHLLTHLKEGNISSPLGMGMRVQADGESTGEDAVLKLRAAVQDTLKVLSCNSDFNLQSCT